MHPDKAERLMRHCRDVLALRDVRQRMDHIMRLAENDQDFRRYFMTVLRADPFTNEADKGRPRAWLMGVGIVLDAIQRTDPQHILHRPNLEIWPVVVAPLRH
jgi:hypothetical protein